VASTRRRLAPETRHQPRVVAVDDDLTQLGSQNWTLSWRKRKRKRRRWRERAKPN